MSAEREPCWLKVSGLLWENRPGRKSGGVERDHPDNDWRHLSSPHPAQSDLLARRMTGLHLDPEEFSRAEPTLFREFQRLCIACESKGRCARDLADEFADPAWQDWRDYCPNASMLSMLSTLRGSHSVAVAPI